MAKFKGREFRVSVRTAPDVYAVIGGIRTESVTINSETVDVTDKDGNGWRELLEGAGITSMSVKGSGVVSNNTVFTNHIMAAKMADTHITIKLESGLGDVFTGKFAVPSVDRAGEYNKEETFSISLESAGVVTYTAAA